MTVTGFNQDIDVLGRTFHLQTQVFLQPGPCIRTEVFHGGKLMASREAPLEGELTGVDEVALRQMMKEQHLKILASVQDRARRYQERQQAKQDSGTQISVVASDQGGALQTADDGEQVEIALSVRRLFERFRQRLDRSPGSIAERLRIASKQLQEVLVNPVFSKIRVDEQVRFHLLNEQLQEWLSGVGDEILAQHIWSEISTFNVYLAEVNNRSELAAFDRDLLRWALRKAEEEGVHERTLEHLNMLYGRDVHLDRLLDEPAGVPQKDWIQHFQRILTALG